MTRYRFARRAEVLGKSVFDHAPGAIILNSGLAHPPLLPDVSREAAQAAQERTAEVMQYAPLMGLDDLRDAVAAFVFEDGVRAERDNILITNGAKHGVDLACRAFVEPGDRVIVSAPTYMTSMQHMRTHGAAFLAVEQDEEGMMTAVLETKLKRLAANGERMPKLLFDVPDFHNPTGITMSLRRRKHLIELAVDYGFVILEDDPYRRVRFEGDSIPPLKALDETGVVFALGTVSKILSPGLRLGWVIGAPDAVRRMAMQKSEGGSCPFTQRIVVDLMRSNRMAETYRPDRRQDEGAPRRHGRGAGQGIARCDRASAPGRLLPLGRIAARRVRRGGGGQGARPWRRGQLGPIELPRGRPRQLPALRLQLSRQGPDRRRHPAARPCLSRGLQPRLAAEIIPLPPEERPCPVRKSALERRPARSTSRATASITAMSACPTRATARPTAGCRCRSCRSATATARAPCSSAAITADEYEGISIFIDLYHSLAPEDIAGQLIFLPAANAPAVYAGRRTSPLDHGGEGNLNRLFPGEKNGTPTETIAWFITNHLIEEVDAIFDLHSAGSSSDHWPSCKIRLMGDQAKDAMQMEFLKLFGAPIGLVGDRVHETTLSGEALPRDIIYVSTELGGAGRITPWIREMGDQGLKRCLKFMGILPESHEIAPPKFEPRMMAMQTEENYIFAYEDGMFEPAVDVGEEVEDGQFAGTIWNVRQPWKEPTRLHFKRGGLVFTKRHPALCQIGDTLFFTLNDYED